MTWLDHFWKRLQWRIHRRRPGAKPHKPVRPLETALAWKELC
ncbi:MAG: hypothetical protein ACK47B_10895 [Armatimonadota bacterium]